MKDVTTFRELWAAANGKTVRKADSEYGHYKSWCAGRGVEPMHEWEFFQAKVVGTKLEEEGKHGTTTVFPVEAASYRESDYVKVQGIWTEVGRLGEQYRLPGGYELLADEGEDDRDERS